MHSLRHLRPIEPGMDGTLYSGGTRFDSTTPLLNPLAEWGLDYTFPSHNCSRCAKDYLAHVGIHPTPAAALSLAARQQRN